MAMVRYCKKFDFYKTFSHCNENTTDDKGEHIL